MKIETTPVPFVSLSGMMSGVDTASHPRLEIISSLESLEHALRGGLLEEWRALADADPRSSLYQAPGWCVAWYRTYSAAFEPRVMLVRDSGQLVGLVPMSLERASRRFDFASGTSADYRDILALPAYRLATVDALLDGYLREDCSNVLEVGWLDPRSDTPSLLDASAALRGLRTRRRIHPCWRWHPSPSEKPHGQRFLNRYARLETTRLERVTTADSWRQFRTAFFLQHSLRQLQAGRALSFHDPVRQRFFDELFASPDVEAHVTALYVNDRLAAGHFGCVWRRVLHLGAPSFSLEEETRSPAVALLCWAMQNSRKLDFDVFDLTIGDTDFKRRMGNQRVELTTVEVHRSAWSFRRAELRRVAVARVRAWVEARWGEGAWKQRVEPLRSNLSDILAQSRASGVWRTAGLVAAAAVHTMYERRVGLVLSVTPDRVRPKAPALRPGERWEVRDNSPEDLLLWSGNSAETEAAIQHTARSYGRARASGRSLHTVLVDGNLMGWGFSCMPNAGDVLELIETPGAKLEFPSNATALQGFFVIPEFRGRGLFQALLSDILKRRFEQGSAVAFITVLEANRPARVAIQRVGFTVQMVNRYLGLFSGRILSSTMSALKR